MADDYTTAAAAAPASPSPPASAGGWYYFNVILLVAVAVAASLWFSRHLETYVDRVVLLGGGVSLWAALRMAWTVFTKSTKHDPWDVSRKLLSSVELSRLLIAAAVVLVVLWLTTGSQYFEYDGPGAADTSMTVQVLRDDDANQNKPLADRQSFGANAVLTPKDPMQGRVFYWRFRTIALQCVLQKQGVPYEPRDCSIRPMESTRTKVPGDFHLKKVHLVRIVPSISLYTMLTNKDAARDSIAYRLTMKLGDKERVVDDLRRGVVYIGGLESEMDELLAMQTEDELKSAIRTELLARKIKPSSADESIAVLMNNQQRLGSDRLSKGQKLSLVVEQLQTEDGKVTVTAVGNPVVHEISDEKVQTIWLPGN